MRKQILYYALKYDGEWQKITKAIAQHEEWNPVAYDGNYITILDEDYPSSLRLLRYPPWILFYEGNKDLLSSYGVGIVGTRQCDAYGISMCKHIVAIVKKKYVIISGVAKGIDACAHSEALDASTIGIIGCGLDVIYPKENYHLYQKLKQHHLLLSEYPNGVKPFAFHFPWRNRLIAALSRAIVVIQAKQRSGTLLTVNEALELDIPIYCVPHSFDSILGKGCNELILQGANILVDDEDIFHI